LTPQRGILADFAANELGWTQVLDRLVKAYNDYRDRAADAEGDEHLDLRGKMRGVHQALVVIEECRKALRSPQ
jgi:hypothetical protein